MGWWQWVATASSSWGLRLRASLPAACKLAGYIIGCRQAGVSSGGGEPGLQSGRRTGAALQRGNAGVLALREASWQAGQRAVGGVRGECAEGSTVPASAVLEQIQKVCLGTHRRKKNCNLRYCVFSVKRNQEISSKHLVKSGSLC
jgi:hypothetical protein